MSEEEEGENKDSSGEQEEEEEDEEEKEKENEKEKINKSKPEEIKRKTRSDYLSIISELQIELESEKKVNNNEKSLLEKEYEKLQNDLSKKKSLLEKLKLTNNKQKIALNTLSKRLEEHKIEKDISDIHIEKSNVKEKETPEDKKLKKATKTMSNLRLENNKLIQILYENKDYTGTINLEDLNKEIKEQIKQKLEEKTVLIKQLKSHSECKEKQKSLKEQITKLEKELKELKIKIQEIKDKTDEMILKKYFVKKTIQNSSIDESNNSHETKNPLVLSKRLKFLNNSTPNIHANKNLKNNYKKLNLPLILSKKSLKEESILTEEFDKKIKNAMKGNDNDYNTLIKKIKLVESKRRKAENKNKTEMNEQETKLNSLDEKYKIMIIDKKHSDLNNQLLKNKLNVIINGNKQLSKQIKQFEKELQNKRNIIKTQNGEISKLLKQIKNIKELASLCEIKTEQSDVEKYINQIKKQKNVNKKIIESKEESKNDIKISTKKNENEESIQTDNPKNKNNNKKPKIKKKLKKPKKEN